MRATRRRGLTLRITLSARSKNFIGVPAQPWLPAMAPHVIRVVHAGQFRASTGQCCLHTSVLQAWIILHNKRPCTTFALHQVYHTRLHHAVPLALHYTHCTTFALQHIRPAPYSPCITVTVPHSLTHTHPAPHSLYHTRLDCICPAPRCTALAHTTPCTISYTTPLPTSCQRAAITVHLEQSTAESHCDSIKYHALACLCNYSSNNHGNNEDASALAVTQVLHHIS